MTIIHDGHGNMIDAEATIEHERDPDELLILCRALLTERNALHRKLDAVRSVVGHVEPIPKPDEAVSTAQMWNAYQGLMRATGASYAECHKAFKKAKGDVELAKDLL